MVHRQVASTLFNTVHLDAGDCYILLHTTDTGRARDHTIYIWRGALAPEVRWRSPSALCNSCK